MNRDKGEVLGLSPLRVGAPGVFHNSLIDVRSILLRHAHDPQILYTRLLIRQVTVKQIRPLPGLLRIHVHACPQLLQSRHKPRMVRMVVGNEHVQFLIGDAQRVHHTAQNLPVPFKPKRGIHHQTAPGLPDQIEIARTHVTVRIGYRLLKQIVVNFLHIVPPSHHCYFPLITSIVKTFRANVK